VLAINDALASKKGNVIVPAFAVGRTQESLYVLGDLVRRGRIASEILIYVDSPMATRVTEITLKHRELTDPESRALVAWQTRDGGNAPRIRFTESTEESIRLNSLRDGAVIISASGMCDAGRIKYHLKYNLPRPESTVLITGFQAAGTLGRRLVDGAPTPLTAGLTAAPENGHLGSVDMLISGCWKFIMRSSVALGVCAPIEQFLLIASLCDLGVGVVTQTNSAGAHAVGPMNNNSVYNRQIR